jgi:hypothetical protein
VRKLEKVKLPRRQVVLLSYGEGEPPPPIPDGVDVILVKESVVPDGDEGRALLAAMKDENRN